MRDRKSQTYSDNYFKRFAVKKPLLSVPVTGGCQIIIVIPCYNEPKLTATLDSLVACTATKAPVEVIVVVNQSKEEEDKIAANNQQTITDFEAWNRAYQRAASENAARLTFHLIRTLDLPQKHAGVGLARKTGMDEALRRFVATDTDGSIVCLDADCQVSANYLKVIETEFASSDAGLGEMHFEHRYEVVQNEKLRTGIVNYELFLRYYVEGLRQAGFPHAIHTIGSCMLVKASVYAKHGGMNKRKAGEDFYFLHKIVPHEPFVSVTEGTVYPSCRTSDRVPFGTGKAQQDWLDQGADIYSTYDPMVYQLLQSMVQSVDLLYGQSLPQAIGELPEVIQHFINSHQYDSKIALIKSNCRNGDQFRKQFFIWFDGFLCMKLIHFLRDNYYPDVPIATAAAKLINSKHIDVEMLLKDYRAIDLRQTN
jgi:glycosyltransferase involved in cell wall biosynthesis